jgi:hypothetical protein
MTLHSHEFIRRFLMYVLPKVFHRVRPYGLLPMATARPAPLGSASSRALPPYSKSYRKKQAPMISAS